MFLANTASLLAGAVFTALLAALAWSDVATRRIPNRLVAALAVAGLCAAATVFREPVGITGAPAGFALGLAVWLPFWLAGAIGAGDVKLAAAIGAWLGPAGVLAASLLAGIAGGVLAVAVLVRRRRIAPFVTGLALWGGAVQRGEWSPPLVDSKTDVLPYGVALSAGALLAGWLPVSWITL